MKPRHSERLARGRGVWSVLGGDTMGDRRPPESRLDTPGLGRMRRGKRIRERKRRTVGTAEGREQPVFLPRPSRVPSARTSDPTGLSQPARGALHT